MATYSPHGITIDGVSLDSSAWNVEAKTRPLAAIRNADVVLPGSDGVSQSLNDDFEATSLSLSMWVLGTDTNGIVPNGVTPMEKVRSNLDELVFLFGKRHGLLNVVEKINSSGATRQAWCKVIDSVTPEVRAGAVAKFTVVLQVGEGMWQDELATDWTQANAVSGVPYEVTTLAGATGPIADATFLVTGPATNPQINDITTTAYVRLNRALAAGETWRVNSATWSTRYGSGLALGTGDTAGSSADAQTVFGGGNARFLRLVPSYTSGARRVFASLTGSGFSTATALSVRARRKYLQ